jgi:hypothetical protein
MRILRVGAHNLAACACRMPTVSRRLQAKVAWSQAERLRLRAPHAGHGMTACVEVLRAEFGVAAATQSNISRWETG